MLQIASSCADLFVGSALVAAAVGKLRDLEGAAVGVLDYRLVRRKLAVPTALTIALAELSLGFGTILGLGPASALSIFLLALLSLVATSALARGLDIDCHCGSKNERLGVNTLVRNGFLMTLLAVGLLIPPPALHLLNADLAYVVCVAIGLTTTTALVATIQVGASARVPAGARS